MKSKDYFFPYSHKNKAKTICEQGDYQKIITELNRHNLFEKEISRIKIQYKNKLSKLTFLNRVDWQMLTVLELFDTKTFEHSLDTLFTLKKKLYRKLENGLTFSEMISKEKVSLEQLFRATLFHDIGKIAVPKFILNSYFTDEHWAQAFVELSEEEKRNILEKHALQIPLEIMNNSQAIMGYFLKNRIRAVRLVPVKYIFSSTQLKSLTDKNFSTDSSLVEIVKLHEEESERILTFSGYPIEAHLAGNHHAYKKNSNQEMKNSNTLTNIAGTIIPNLIHLADIRSALRSNRPYHTQKPRIRIMAFIMDDVKNGLIDPQIAYLWIKDDLKKLGNEDWEISLKHDRDHPDFKYLNDIEKELEDVNAFLQKISNKKQSS